MRLNWGTGIAIFYGLFAAATVGFAVFAMDQKVDLVSDDYYQRALDHDRRMEAATNAAALGTAFQMGAGDGGRALTLSWSAARPDGGTVTLYRPSDASADRSFRISPDAAGHQRLSLAGLPAGHWVVQVQWQSGGREYFIEQPMSTP